MSLHFKFNSYEKKQTIFGSFMVIIFLGIYFGLRILRDYSPRSCEELYFQRFWILIFFVFLNLILFVWVIFSFFPPAEGKITWTQRILAPLWNSFLGTRILNFICWLLEARDAAFNSFITSLPPFWILQGVLPSLLRGCNSHYHFGWVFTNILPLVPPFLLLGEVLFSSKIQIFYFSLLLYFFPFFFTIFQRFRYSLGLALKEISYMGKVALTLVPSQRDEIVLEPLPELDRETGEFLVNKWLIGHFLLEQFYAPPIFPNLAKFLRILRFFIFLLVWTTVLVLGHLNLLNLLPLEICFFA